MNIFVLDTDPRAAALYHCNKHVLKMILETGQMLCTSHWMHHLWNADKSLSDFKRVRDAQGWLYENVPKKEQPPWKLTHARHPCTRWVSENVSNYGWTLTLGESLLTQYTVRYNKKHSTYYVFEWLRENYPPGIADGYITNHPVCMNDEYKVYDSYGNISAVDSYKQYYILDKSRFAKWEPHARTPTWYEKGLEEVKNGE